MISPNTQSETKIIKGTIKSVVNNWVEATDLPPPLDTLRNNFIGLDLTMKNLQKEKIYSYLKSKDKGIEALSKALFHYLSGQSLLYLTAKAGDRHPEIAMDLDEYEFYAQLNLSKGMKTIHKKCFGKYPLKEIINSIKECEEHLREKINKGMPDSFNLSLQELHTVMNEKAANIYYALRNYDIDFNSEED